MDNDKLEIPPIVWETLHKGRMRLMTGVGYPEFAAREFADTEVEWRKRDAARIAPEFGLLADMVWIRGPGTRIDWSLEVIVPPIPKDIRSLLAD